MSAAFPKDRPSTEAPEPGAEPASLADWLRLAATQQRAFTALCDELKLSSDLVEDSTVALSDRFRSLAENASRQSNGMREIANLTTHVQLADRALPIEEIPSHLQEILDGVIQTILYMSKEGMTLVYVLRGLIEQVDQIERCVTQIERINRETRMLAMNAKIEAVRAGRAGLGFSVVSDEVRDLSGSIDHLAEDMKDKIIGLVNKLREGYEQLHRVASLDMSQHIMAKEELENVVTGLIDRNAALMDSLAESASVSQKIAEDVSQSVTGIQFQDRTSQRLGNVIAALKVLENAVAGLSARTPALGADEAEDAAADAVWLADIINQCTLGEMRSRFARTLLLNDGDAETCDMTSQSNGPDIELF